MDFDTRYGMTFCKYPGYELTTEIIRAQQNNSILDGCFAENLKDASPIFLDEISRLRLCSEIQQGNGRATRKYIFIVLAAISLIWFLIAAFTPETSAEDIYAPGFMFIVSALGSVMSIFDEKSANSAAQAVHNGNYQAYEYAVTDRMWKVVSSSEGYDKYFYISVNGVIVEVSESFYMASSTSSTLKGAIINTYQGELFVLFQ